MKRKPVKNPWNKRRFDAQNKVLLEALSDNRTRLDIVLRNWDAYSYDVRELRSRIEMIERDIARVRLSINPGLLK
jgi:hypothetical protein